jgi:hypothetical protein
MESAVKAIKLPEALGNAVLSRRFLAQVYFQRAIGCNLFQRSVGLRGYARNVSAYMVVGRPW